MILDEQHLLLHDTAQDVCLSIAPDQFLLLDRESREALQNLAMYCGCSHIAWFQIPLDTEEHNLYCAAQKNEPIRDSREISETDSRVRFHKPTNKTDPVKAKEVVQTIVEELGKEKKMETTIRPEEIVTSTENVNQDILDEMVHDELSRQATNINNSGKDEQIAFLVETLGPDEFIEELVRRRK